MAPLVRRLQTLYQVSAEVVSPEPVSVTLSHVEESRQKKNRYSRDFFFTNYDQSSTGPLEDIPFDTKAGEIVEQPVFTIPRTSPYQELADGAVLANEPRIIPFSEESRPERNLGRHFFFLQHDQASTGPLEAPAETPDPSIPFPEDRVVVPPAASKEFFTSIEHFSVGPLDDIPFDTKAGEIVEQPVFTTRKTTIYQGNFEPVESPELAPVVLPQSVEGDTRRIPKFDWLLESGQHTGPLGNFITVTDTAFPSSEESRETLQRQKYFYWLFETVSSPESTHPEESPTPLLAQDTVFIPSSARKQAIDPEGFVGALQDVTEAPDPVIPFSGEGDYTLLPPVRRPFPEFVSSGPVTEPPVAPDPVIPFSGEGDYVLLPPVRRPFPEFASSGPLTEPPAASDPVIPFSVESQETLQRRKRALPPEDSGVPVEGRPTPFSAVGESDEFSLGFLLKKASVQFLHDIAASVGPLETFGPPPADPILPQVEEPVMMPRRLRRNLTLPDGMEGLPSLGESLDPPFRLGIRDTVLIRERFNDTVLIRERHTVTVNVREDLS